MADLRMSWLLIAVAAWSSSSEAGAAPLADGPVYGPELQGYEYPYPVHDFQFVSQRQRLDLVYMDVAAEPARSNHRTVLLLHGKNYCSATWAPTIKVLHQAGYRVIAVDQIGFCKSSKPAAYQFSFEQLAANTHALLAMLGVDHVSLVGHSIGGMLAIRYAWGYPRQVGRLVLVDPIGLEDWRAKGVPPVGVDQWYQRELKTSANGIRRYEQAIYFAGQWRSDWEPPVQMLAGMYRGPGRAQVAWNSALLYDMILTQPVCYQFEQLRVSTVLMIGDRDVTAIGKDFAPPSVRAALGHYPQLAREAVARMPHARLVEFNGVGHAPQLQVPERFHQALLLALDPGSTKDH